MRISLLTLIAAATIALSACNSSSGSGGGDYSYKSPEPEYKSQLIKGVAYTGDADFTDEAERRFNSADEFNIRSGGEDGDSDSNHNEQDNCYSYTKYPIILVHGLYGFDDILGFKTDEGIGFTPGELSESEEIACKALGYSCESNSLTKGVSYWHKVSEAIELGGGLAIPVAVPKLNSTEERGARLLKQLQELSKLEDTNSHNGCGEISFEKFHLMGHSHGGPTVRYILAEQPDLLASVTTIGGLNVYGIPETGALFSYYKCDDEEECNKRSYEPITRYNQVDNDDIKWNFATHINQQKEELEKAYNKIAAKPNPTLIEKAKANDLVKKHEKLSVFTSTFDFNDPDILCSEDIQSTEKGNLSPDLSDYPQCNTMANFMTGLESFAKGPLYQGMLNGLAELIEFVGGDKQNDTSNAVASLTSLSAAGIAEYNYSDTADRTIGLPKYHELFLADRPLYGLGLQDPCLNNYFEKAGDLFGEEYAQIFGETKDECEQALHGASFAKIIEFEGANKPVAMEGNADDLENKEIKKIFLFSWSGTRMTERNSFDPTDFLTAASACALSAIDTKVNNLYTLDNLDNRIEKLSLTVSEFFCPLLSDSDTCREKAQANKEVKAELEQYTKQFICTDDDIIEPNDGMVQQFSSHFGTVLRSDYNLNHLDEINWLFDSYPATGSSFEESDPTFTPLAIYRVHANRLQQLEEKFNQ